MENGQLPMHNDIPLNDILNGGYTKRKEKANTDFLSDDEANWYYGEMDDDPNLYLKYQVILLWSRADMHILE